MQTVQRLCYDYDNTSNRYELQINRLILGVSGVLAGLVILVLVISSTRAANQAETELERIRAAGHPATAAELAERRRLPPGAEDITEQWLVPSRVLSSQAFETDGQDLPIVGNSQKEIPPPGRPWPDLEAAEKLLAKYREPMEQLHEAAGLEGAARYTTDFSAGINIPLPGVQSIRAGARMLQLEAYVRAHRGDSAGAAESIHTGFKLARSLEREPILVSQLVYIACDGVAIEPVRTLLPHVEFSEEDLIRLQEDLRSAQYGEGMHEALVGERVFGIMMFNDPGSMGGPPGGWSGKLWRLTQRKGFTFYLEHMDRLIEAVNQPWPFALGVAEQAEVELNETIEGGSGLGKMRYMFVALAAPALSAAVSAGARAEAWSEAADTAIAIERYRRGHDRLPERLEALVPGFLPRVPSDPFDGKPLRYVVEGEDYLIYSVGPNRIDDGGQGDASGEPDLVFRPGFESEVQEEEGPDDPPE
jgi:hypothetical protein